MLRRQTYYPQNNSSEGLERIQQYTVVMQMEYQMELSSKKTELEDPN